MIAFYLREMEGGGGGEFWISRVSMLDSYSGSIELVGGEYLNRG